MASEKEKHDYSLLGSFMPKDVPETRPSIPVQLDLGPDNTAPGKPDEQKASDKKER